MPKVNPIRDTSMALNGLMRTTIVAKLFNVSTSTIGKWDDVAVPHLRVGGLNWVSFEKARAFRIAEADALKLPHDAILALEYARSKGLV